MLIIQRVPECIPNWYLNPLSCRDHFPCPWNATTLGKTQHLFNNAQQTSHNVLLEEKEMQCPNKMQGEFTGTV